MRFILILLFTLPAMAKPISEVASFNSGASSQVSGIGLVVGLPGTGDNIPTNTLQQKLKSYEFTGDINLAQRGSSAIVLLSGSITNGSAPGTSLTIDVKTTGNATDLTGGTLVAVNLRSNLDSSSATAQGSINTASDGHNIVNGSVVQSTAASSSRSDYIELKLFKSDYMTATKIINAINSTFSFDTAQLKSVEVIKIQAPRDANTRLQFEAQILNLEF